MKNTSLKTDLPRIMDNKKNITSIHKGGVSGGSLEITYIEPDSHASYLYTSIQDRDADLNTLNTLVKI